MTAKNVCALDGNDTKLSTLVQDGLAALHAACFHVLRALEADFLNGRLLAASGAEVLLRP